MSVTTVQPHQSSLGMDANIAALIAYIAGAVLLWVPVIMYVAFLAPLVIFILEKKSSFVRFHAMQAFVLSAIGEILSIILGIISASIVARSILTDPFAGLRSLGVISTIVLIINLVLLAVSIIAMMSAYQYKEYKIPLIGDLACKLSSMGKGSL